MSTTENTATTTVEKVKVALGLMIRKFKGAIAKTEKSPEVKYEYERICLPWSRTGKDVEDKDVDGAVPTLAEVMAYCQKSGFTVEFKLDSTNNPEGPSIVGFLVDGINGHLNRVARAKAENTPEQAFEKGLQLMISKSGLTREQVMAMLALKVAEVSPAPTPEVPPAQ